MIEIEKTYLAKYIPEDLENFPSKIITDTYFPAHLEHPVLRLRKSGDNHNLTKKFPVKEGDASTQIEETINLDENEASELRKIAGKRVSKKRYYYEFEEQKAEIDVFLEDLAGLVLVDVEFENQNDKTEFSMPDFCLADVTQEKIMAGGMICGKKYEEIENTLNKYGYRKLNYRQ